MISGIELIIAWLSPLGAVGAQRDTAGPIPFRLVECVAGADDKITDSSIYQVSTFAATLDAAETEAFKTHDRMLRLGPPLAAQQRVTLVGGAKVFVDSVTTSQRPLWVAFAESSPVERFVARYLVDIRLPAGS